MLVLLYNPLIVGYRGPYWLIPTYFVQDFADLHLAGPYQAIYTYRASGRSIGTQPLSLQT